MRYAPSFATRPWHRDANYAERQQALMLLSAMLSFFRIFSECSNLPELQHGQCHWASRIASFAVPRQCEFWWLS